MTRNYWKQNHKNNQSDEAFNKKYTTVRRSIVLFSIPGLCMQAAHWILSDAMSAQEAANDPPQN